MSGPDLPRWESVLATATTELPEIRVLRGTKGGRIRSVPVFHIGGAHAAVQRAIAVAASNGGHLLPGILPQALSRVYTVCSGLGMVGASSPHSARYAYCCGLIVHLHAAGWSEREALARAANALGHGAQRTTWVRAVYGQSIGDLWSVPHAGVSHLGPGSMTGALPDCSIQQARTARNHEAPALSTPPSNSNPDRHA